MSPTRRTAMLAGALALAALLLPAGVVLLGALALGALVLLDGRAARPVPEVERTVPTILARGVPATIEVNCESASRVRVRQPAPPDVSLVPAEADGALLAEVIG